MNQQEALEYVKKTIITGDKKRIVAVLEHYLKAYGKSGSNGTKELLQSKDNIPTNEVRPEKDPQTPEFWAK
jgi:hypothetical protein